MSHRLFFAFAALLILILASPARAQPADQPADQPKLTLAIRSDQQSFKAGDEIPIVFEITNTGTAPYEYWDRSYDRSGRMPEFKLTAAKNGAPLPDPREVLKGAFFFGGLAPSATLAPGKSFTKTIVLNRWVLISQPGKYTVIGSYHLFKDNPYVISPSIDITVTPRTDEEMAAYIKDLSAQLTAVLAAKREPGDDKASPLIQKLMYTRDPRILPALVKAMNTPDSGNAAFWAGEAIECYLPKDEKNTEALIESATKNGLTNGMVRLLQNTGVPQDKIKKLIAISLSPDHPASHAEAALAAQQLSDDSFTPRLIAIATDKKSPARVQAIYALAFNRTDESVATLKQLLKENNPQPYTSDTIAKTTRASIRIAYTLRGNTQGRKLSPDDFDKDFQEPAKPPHE